MDKNKAREIFPLIFSFSISSKHFPLDVSLCFFLAIWPQVICQTAFVPTERVCNVRNCRHAVIWRQIATEQKWFFFISKNCFISIKFHFVDEIIRSWRLFDLQKEFSFVSLRAIKIDNKIISKMFEMLIRQSRCIDTASLISVIDRSRNHLNEVQ